MTCPVSPTNQEIITLEHGSGGKSTSDLIERIFLPAFRNSALEMMHDGAVLQVPKNQIAFTTDSYVVQPVFFPGGDIGKLAVTGTVNDLAMCGAKPYWLSCSFIIEEGFFQSDLERIVRSMQAEANAQSVQIVTGDTKVIERQTGKNIFITTSGIGIQMASSPINPLQIVPGDAIIISNDIGRHGVAVMAKREGFTFSSPLISDCACLFAIVQNLIEAGIEIHCLRDLTRGGLATGLVDIAEKAKLEFSVSEECIHIDPTVVSACEILGLDALYIANEGCFIAFVPERHATEALAIIRQFPEGKHASIIGKAIASSASGKVKLRNAFGVQRYLHQLSGNQLPRIC